MHLKGDWISSPLLHALAEALDLRYQGISIFLTGALALTPAIALAGAVVFFCIFMCLYIVSLFKSFFYELLISLRKS